MKTWKNETAIGPTQSPSPGVPTTPAPIPHPKTSVSAFSRRRLLGGLGCCVAALAAAPALAAKPPLPRCGKGAEQLLALGEYEKALNALPSEADCPELKNLRDRFFSRPIHKKRIPATRGGHKVDVAVFQAGKIGADRVVVFVHGVLAEHRTWFYVGGALGDDQELWLLDLPGCGESDGHPAQLESDAFTPTALAERVGLVLEQCLAERAAAGQPAPRLTLVGHSLGGMISLRLLSSPALRDRFASVRRQLDAMVLFAPCDIAVNSVPPNFATLLGLTPVKIGIGRALGVVDDKVKALTRTRFFLPECATREQAERFTEALARPAHLRSNQAMVRRAIPWRLKENRPNWPAITTLEAEYANVDVPCLIAWGEWDETLTETMGHKIRDHVPGARLVEITGAGHSVISEKPLACAKIICAGLAAVADGRFAALPLVCRYGQHPFYEPQVLARNG
jgi:pimeloyl-ACP methyl ester carboxylesterase